MKEQRIIIDIDAEGGITAEADGFSGDACLADLGRVLADLASAWQRVERKPDADRAPVRRTNLLTTGRKT